MIQTMRILTKPPKSGGSFEKKSLQKTPSGLAQKGKV